MELCYRNNPKSLFRKYKHLITDATKHQLFRDYLQDAFPLPQEKLALLLPNGFIRERDRGQYQMVVTSRAVYAPKLYSALYALDSVSQWIRDFRQAQQLLAWNLKLSNHVPDISKMVHLNQTIFNPDAAPETTSVDGYAERAGVDESFATIRAGAASGAGDSDATKDRIPGIAATAIADQWSSLRRGILLFDTSSLTAAATIQSTSKFSLFAIAPQEAGITDSYSLVDSTPASNTAVASGDYANVGTTLYATAKTQAAVTQDVYNDWTLNATGLANVSLTSITKMGMRVEGDRANASPTWASLQAAGHAVNLADNGSDKPKLTIDFGIGILDLTSKMW